MFQLGKYQGKRTLAKVLLACICVIQGFQSGLLVPVASAASAPNIIGYQGRVLNANGIPVTDATINMVFELYTDVAAGSCVWSNSSVTCASATPRSVTLTDGLFSEALGDTGSAYAAIGDSIFGDNTALYLQITVGGEALTPRKQIAAAPYALNSDTIDGLDADTDGATVSAIVALNSSGNVVFTGDPTGATVSTGVVYINPAAAAADETLFGIGDNATDRFRIDKEGDVFIKGIELDGVGVSNVTSGASQIGVYFTELSLSSGTNVQDVLDDLDQAIDDIVTGGAVSKWTDAGAFTYLTATADDLVIGNSTVAGASLFFDESVGQLDLGTDSALAGSLRLYSVTAATADPILAADASGNLDITTAAVEVSGDLAIDGGDLTSGATTFNLLAATATTVNTFAAATTLNINDAAVTSTIDIGGVTSSGTNTVSIATNSTAADVIAIGNSNALTTVAITGGDDWSITGAGVLTMSASSSATTAILITDTDYTNSLSIADNDISGTTFDLIGTTATIDFTNFDVASTGAITVAAGQGLDTNGAGALALGNTTATSISVCNSAACDTISLGTNADADTITIGDALDNVSINDAQWSISAAGTGTFVDVVCTDCLDFAELADSLALDASTSIVMDGAETFTITNTSSGNILVDLDSTGDFVFRDGAASFFALNDDTTLDFNPTEDDTVIFDINANSLTTSNLLDVDVNALTSGSFLNARSSSTFSGDFSQYSFSGATTGNIFAVTSTSATATSNIFDIDLDNGDNDNDVFTLITDETTNSGSAADSVKARITASGEFFSDRGFTAGGASTKYYDGQITTSSVATFDFQDASGASTTLDIGGVTTSLANTVNIATNSTAADVISIGNSNASSTVAIIGGDDWSITSGGAATFTALTLTNLTLSGDLAVNGDDITSDGTLTIDSSGIVQLGTNDDFAVTGDVDFTFVTGGASTENLVIDITHATDATVTGEVITLTNTAATDTGTNYLLALVNADDGGATGTPDGLLALLQADSNELVAAGITFDVAAGGLTDAIDASDPQIVNALSVGANDIVGTTGAFDFTNFDVASTGAITVAAGVGLDTNAAGALALGNTNATSVSVCNSAACDTLSLATNADADTVTIGDALDSVAITSANWSVTSAGLITTADDVAINGGDLTTSGATFNLLATNATTVNTFAAATTLNINDAAVTSTIDIGGNDASGTNTVRIATNSTAADLIAIGNSNTSTTVAIVGGDDWSISATGNATFAGSTVLGDAASDTVAINGTITNASLNFEGATNDGFETIFAITDPTVIDKTITFPNATGTVAVSATGPITLSALGDIGCVTCLTSSTAFVQNGNSFSADAVLGTNDAFDLILEVANTTAVTITDSTLLATFAGSVAIGTNSLTGTTAAIDFTNFDVATTGAITVAAGVGLDTNAAGNLSLGGTNATGIAVCNSAACDTFTLGTNADADSITIGDGSMDTVAIGGVNWTIVGSGAATFETIDANDDVSLTFVTDGANSENLGISVTHATDVNLNAMSMIITDTAAADTGTNNFVLLQNANDGGATGIFDAFININNADVNEAMQDGIIIQSGAGTIVDALDVSDAEIGYGINLGENGILTASYQMFDTGSGTFLWQDLSSNNLLTLVDGGSTATLNLAGSLVVTGAAVDSVFNLASTGDFIVQDNGTAFLTLSDAGAITFVQDAVDNPALTFTNNGSGNQVFNLAGTGDFTVQDNAATFLTLSDAGALTYTSDVTDNPAFTVTSSGSGNIVFDQDGNGDFIHDLDSAGQILYRTAGTTLGSMTGGFAGGLNFTFEQLDEDHSSSIDLVNFNQTYTATTNCCGENVLQVSRALTNNFATTVNLSTPVVDISSTNANTGATFNDSAIVLRVDQNYASATGDVASLFNAGTGTTLRITPEGDTPAYTGSGGLILPANDAALFIDNSTNSGGALAIYSSGVSNTAALATFAATAGFAQPVVEIQNNTTGETENFGLLITQNNVGDTSGTTTTAHALVLDVQEAANDEDVMVIRSDSDGTPDIEFRIDNNGTVTADDAFTGGGADFAEFFYTLDASLGDYQVVCQDIENNLAVKKCGLGDRTVVGVVSVNPAFIGNNLAGAEGSLEDNPNYRIVGLEGQIETYVTAADGTIAVGDALTSSGVTAGYAGKATGPGRVIGYALEPMASGSGLIKVRVSPGWDAGEILADDGGLSDFDNTLALNSLFTATAGAPASDSNALAFRGSAWNGSAAETVAMTLSNKVTNASNYRLSVANNSGAEVAYINNLGDLVLSGKLYPSNQGIAQTSAYIYYDSNGVGYMRTNAAGWGTGSYDFAELFPSPEVLIPGDVVVFGNGAEQVKRSTGQTYDDRIAGVVSTRPGFLAGNYRPGDSPIALSGRVPTRVNTENGAIAIGDPLTTSSTPGVAMKATKPGPIVGYAMQPLPSGSGNLIVFIRASYYDGSGSGSSTIVTSPVSEVGSAGNLSSLNLNGGSITSVASISGLGNTWSLTEGGDLITRGRLVQIVKSHQNEDVETYAVASQEMTIQLSGTATFNTNAAIVKFEDIDPQFNDIIGNNSPYRVLATPAGLTGQIYVTDRTTSGFTIRAENADNGVLVDWLVIAYHKDYEPAPMATPPTENAEVTPEPEVAGETIEESAPEPVLEPILEEPVIPAEEPTIPSDEPAAPKEPVVEVVEDVPILEEPVAPEPTPETEVAP